jgi:hypothetical protein
MQLGLIIIIDAEAVHITATSSWYHVALGHCQPPAGLIPQPLLSKFIVLPGFTYLQAVWNFL